MQYITARPELLSKKEQFCHELAQPEPQKVRVLNRGSKFLCFSLMGLEIDRTRLEDSSENLFCLEKKTGYEKRTPLMPIRELLAKEFVFQVPKRELVTGTTFNFGLYNDRAGSLIEVCNFNIKFEVGEFQVDKVFTYRGEH